jgi:hypothetical protein
MAKAKKTAPADQEIPAPPYQMTPKESETLNKRAAERSRGSPPMKLCRGGQVGPDHPDLHLGYHLIFEDLGVDSEFGMQLVEQLARSVKHNGIVDLGKLNFLLSYIKNLKPRDAFEVTLISQAALAHLRCMEAATLAAAVTDPDWRERHDRRTVQFMRTSVIQSQALKQYRSDSGRHTLIIQRVTSTHDNPARGAGVTTHDHHETPRALPHENRAPVPLIEGEGVPVPTGKLEGDNDE